MSKNSYIKKPKLYALLVGINSYEETILLAGKKVRFPKLYGCVSDANKIRDYLKTESSFDCKIEMLLDESATKQEVVRLFQDHLGKAEKNDTVLFYFSGHGTQEFADKSVFQSETDGRLESIACYYNDSQADFLLSDKELRWLIYRLSLKGPHIVTIFDCCHSGDNTRNGYLLKESFGKVVEKRVPFVFPQRNWEQFIFSKYLNKDVFLQSGEYFALPEGKHYHFSACESDESAIEISGEAVFTKVLLNVLNNSGGDITYHSLGSRIRQYMRNVYEQKPKVYVANSEPNDMFRNFLNKPLRENKNIYGEVTFNENTGWQLNLGAINGISKNTPELTIFDPENSSRNVQGAIHSVNIDSSALIIKDDLDKNKVYKANIEGLTGETLRIHFAPNEAELTDQLKIFEQIFKKDSKPSVIAENNEQKAQYVLRYLNGKYYLTYPNDSYRPLVKPILANDKEAVSKLLSDLNHIANWESLKNLSNQDPVTVLSSDDLKVDISTGMQPTQSKTIKNNDSIDIKYELKGGKWTSSISIRLTNNSGRNLYCCAIYMPSNFASVTTGLNPPVKMIGPNESVEIKYNDNAIINIGISKTMKWYNWKEQKDYFKFIISTENFDSTLLNCKNLDNPDIPLDTIKRHLITEETTEISTTNRSGWFTKQIEIVLKNPEFNVVSEDDLKVMMDCAETSDFSLGLYFVTSDDGFNTGYKLKPDIQIKNEIKRGIVGDKIIDIANWWSRKKRNQFYKESLIRFPNRIKIVSEGDSWFQHPLVLDIIDHLYRVYNIYCVSAAGDTLRNYFSNEKKNGEYYMDALDEKDPAFFLISGGGNDILGSQFSNYLVSDSQNNIPEGENPRRFLKDEIFKEFESLMEIYKSAFTHLKTHKPKIHIIVHGYDYPVKLNNAKKGWLGKYMIEKNIGRPGDRIAIIHLIMDTFNQKLSELSKSFENVTYIDVRKMVRFDEKEGVDQWYDEIHPNNDGFQQIAMKFMQTIDGIVATKKKIT
jgi:lysophospholipase L1-like esterase